MRGLFSPLSFSGFGPAHLTPGTEAPTVRVHAVRRGGLRARVRLEAPRRPGVYGMVDERGELVYVGKAKCLRSRLLSYFRPRSRDERATEIIREARLIAWELAATEFAALLRELELIRRWQPRFNVHGQPRRRRRTFVCVGRRPAPYVFLAARPPGTALVVFGPVPAGERTTEAVRRVNDLFLLRDCPQAQTMFFADEQELFPIIRPAGCLRHEIGSCLAPCAAACTFDEYRQQVEAVREFLTGENASSLALLERAMLEAAAHEEFERAAALRDRLEALGWLVEHLARLRRARALSAVYPLRSADGPELWYSIRRGEVRGVVPAPQAAAGREQARQMVESLLSSPSPAGPELDEWLDGVLLVDSWFRKHPAERDRLLTPAEALRRCWVSG